MSLWAELINVFYHYCWDSLSASVIGWHGWVETFFLATHTRASPPPPPLSQRKRSYLSTQPSLPPSSALLPGCLFD